MGPAEAAEPIKRTEGVAAADAVQKATAAEAADAVRRVAEVGALSRSAASEKVQSITDRLRRGVLTPSQAVEELIDDAVRSNLPGLGSESPLSRELRALLLSYAKDDLYLASRISRLGIHR